jgi:hypothetical protein
VARCGRCNLEPVLCADYSPHTILDANTVWQHPVALRTSGFWRTLFVYRAPLKSSGQSSWLQIRRPGFDSRHYQKKEVVGLERGPLILVCTTEELRDRKVAAPV